MRLRLASLLLAFFSASLALPAADESPVGVAQHLFDAMKTHDAAAAMALFVPGATMASMDKEGKIAITPVDKWAERIGSSKSMLLERMWDAKVLEHGAIATVWAPYDFHADGKFTHCGIDSFMMLKTEKGWKIAGLSFTRETNGCQPSPLGEPGR